MGMAAIACGLLLTTLETITSNKPNSSGTKIKQLLHILQAELLPSLASDMAASLGSLKDNLDAFNQEFSQNITSFKGTIAGITENLSLQKEFLEMLQKGGYQQIVQANVEVFDRIEKSMPVLDSLSVLLKKQCSY
jgi:Sec-independent protein translocase protein TatA